MKRSRRREENPIANMPQHGANEPGKSSVEKPGIDPCNLLSQVQQKVVKPLVYPAFVISRFRAEAGNGRPEAEAARWQADGTDANCGELRLLTSAATIGRQFFPPSVQAALRTAQQNQLRSAALPLDAWSLAPPLRLAL